MKFIGKKKWTVWSLVLFVFISGNIEAQDSIVSHVGEVTYGRVLASFDFNDYKYIDFENEAGVVTRYRPGEISGFGLDNGRQFVSKDLPKVNRMVFAQKVFSGTINMYRYRGKFYLEKDSEIQRLQMMKSIKELEGKKWLATRKYYVGVLNRFMAGSCGIQLQKTINKTKLKQEDFVNLLGAFHECESLPYEIPGRDIPSLKVSPIVKVGAGNLGLSPEKRTVGRADALEKSILPYAFLGVRLHSLRYSPRVFYDIGIGVSAQSNSINSAFQQNNFTTLTGREDYSFVSGFLPISVNYLISRNSFNELYIGAGVTVMFSQTRSNFAMIDIRERVFRYERESDVRLLEQSFFASRDFNGAPHINFGSNLFLTQKLHLVLEAKTELFPDQYNLVLLYNHSHYNLLFSTVSIGLRF